jgi:hypothetical protein
MPPGDDPPRAEEPQYLSDNEVLDAMRTLPLSEWKKLAYWSRIMWPQDANKIYVATLTRIDPRKRGQNKLRFRRLRGDRPVIVGLYYVMKSIRSEWIKAGDTEVTTVTGNDPYYEGAQAGHAIASYGSPAVDEDDAFVHATREAAEEEQFLNAFEAAIQERMAAAKMNQDRREQEQLARFADRAVVQKVMAGIQKKFRGQALCDYAGVDMPTLKTIRQMIYRRNKAADGEKGPSDV